MAETENTRKGIRRARPTRRQYELRQIRIRLIKTTSSPRTNPTFDNLVPAKLTRLTGLPVSLEGLLDELLSLTAPRASPCFTERPEDRIHSLFRPGPDLLRGLGARVAGRGMMTVARVMPLAKGLAHHRLDHRLIHRRRSVDVSAE